MALADRRLNDRPPICLWRLAAAFGIASLALAAYGKNKNGVELDNVPVQSDIAMRASANDQFPQVLAQGAADQGIVSQYVDCFDDFANSLGGIFNLISGKVIDNSIKIFPDFRCQFDSGHLQGASLRASGRLADSPSRRASR